MIYLIIFFKIKKEFIFIIIKICIIKCVKKLNNLLYFWHKHDTNMKTYMFKYEIKIPNILLSNFRLIALLYFNFLIF